MERKRWVFVSDLEWDQVLRAVDNGLGSSSVEVCINHSPHPSISFAQGSGYMQPSCERL